MATDSTPRRDRLIERLMDVFLADGFLGFSIGDLAARLRCSKSTVYSIAPSKEQIVTTVVRAFFRRSTERVEARVGTGTPAQRIGAYLDAISVELKPASPSFFADLEAFPPAKDLYRHNTEIAAARVQQLMTESLGANAAAALDARFVATVAGETMELIQRGQIEAATGLDDSAAYRALADLIVAGMTDRTG